MKEQEFIEIIKNKTQSSLIGDDCAYLKEFGIVLSQDNFVENVHFKREWATPFQIGYKAAAVNISDILASGGKPEYLSVGMSLPNDIEAEFISEFFDGFIKGSYGAKVCGGDITGGDSIFISVTAIGSTGGRKISSRKNAKAGYKIITRGEYGLSSKGLEELIKGGNNAKLIKAHLEPELDTEFSEMISANVKEVYAMMDTSDGLADALFQIAKASNVTIKSGYIEGMFSAEDYRLVAAVPAEFSDKFNNCDVIGECLPFNGYYLEAGGKKYANYNELNLFDHFGE